MKKEFKAPIVEMRELDALNTIMDGAMLISSNGVNEKTKFAEIEVSIKDGYKQWRKNR